ncbi:hypothetical protein ACFL3V_04930 [Nanoarchaeota archaeon]
MAKISIHIPDETLERVRMYKDQLNISKICSTALLREVETISNVPPMVEETRKLIDRLAKETQKKHIESFNLGVKLALAQMSKVTYEQLRFWGSMVFSEKQRLILPEELENYLEKVSLEKQMSHPLHRPSFSKGWLSVMKRTWKTVKDKI